MAVEPLEGFVARHRRRWLARVSLLRNRYVTGHILVVDGGMTLVL